MSVMEPHKFKSEKNVIVIGSSHCRGIGPKLQASLGDEYAVMSIFKPNAT